MDTVSQEKNSMDRWLGYSLVVICVVMIIYHLYYIVALPYEASVHSIVHLGFAFVVLVFHGMIKSPRFRILRIAMLVMLVGVSIYFLTHYGVILENTSYPPKMALVAGVIAAVCVFVITYENYGLMFPALSAIGVLYMYFGSYLPESISAPSVDLDRLITLLSADVTSPWGVYGSLLIISANYLFLFIFFGAALDAFGGMRAVKTIGTLAAYRFRSGPAALSVFTSALLGSITGSTVANITITGSFTIPLMKKTGYTPEMAAAVETGASSGGQILPPVMGSTAFIMSGYTGIPYVNICIASVLSALIYYAALLFYAEINARKIGIEPMTREGVSLKNLLLDAPVFIGPLAFLTYMLIRGYSVMLTIFWSVVCVVGLGLLNGIRRDARLDWRIVKDKIVDGIRSGSQVAVVLSLIGVVVGVVEVTGLGMRLGNVFVALSGSNLLVLLFMTAVTAMILGMGVPSGAAYIICATVLSPALIKLGVPMLQAHLFPLYFAVFSHLTPPVAIGLMVACKMAGANYLRGGKEAMKFVLPTFLLPFLFVYTPSILMQFGSLSSVIQEFASFLLAIGALCIMTLGYWASSLNWTERMILLISICILLASIFFRLHYVFVIAGGVLALMVTLLNVRRTRQLTVKQTQLVT